MTRKSNKIPAAENAAPQPANDQDELSLAELAQGVLSRVIRPRVADVRRLAEAVLAAEADNRKKTKQAKDKKKDKGGAGKKAGKKHKLARIPRQNSKK